MSYKHIARYVASIAAFLLLLVFLFGPEGEICEQAKDAAANDCSLSNLVLVAFWQIGKFLDRWSAAIVAVATLVVAFFTYTLWRSTNELSAAAKQQGIDAKTSLDINRIAAEAARKSANVARDTLIATRRPLMTLEIKPLSDFHANETFFGFNMSIKAKNVGPTPAMDVAISIDFMRHRLLGTGDDEVIAPFVTEWMEHHEAQIVFPDAPSTHTSLLRNFPMPAEHEPEWCEFVAWVSYGMMFDDRRYYTAIFFSLYDKRTDGGILHPTFRGRVSAENLAVIGRGFIT